MNEKEKQEYLQNGLYLQAVRPEDCLFGEAFLAYMNSCDIYFNSLPKSLYKYKNFSEEGHVFEMLKDGYLYFSDSNKQNDQFECLMSFNKEKISSLSQKQLFAQYKKAIIAAVHESIPDVPISLITDLVKVAAKDGSIDEDKASSYLASHCPNSGGEVSHLLHQCLSKEKNVFDKKELTSPLEVAIDELPKTRERLKMCSLSETNKSQPMWSFYSDDYRGCCIEYDFSRLSSIDLQKPFSKMPLPVLYANKRNNDLFSILLESLIKSFLLSVQKQMDYSFLFSFLHVFFIKNTEWSFEKEWRIFLIDTPDRKWPAPPIKAVYLGKNVPTKSANKEKILALAREKSFSVFEQIDDFGRLSFSFKPIFVSEK
jgi:hypothetical protein